MDKDKIRYKLAREIAKVWNKNNIKYAVVHGLNVEDKSIGRDLDIIIDPIDSYKAISIAINKAKEFNFNKHLFRWSEWGLYQLVLINEEFLISLPIDLLLTEKVWRCKVIQFVNQNLFFYLLNNIDYVDSFKYSYDGAFLKTVIRPLLCGDIEKAIKERKKMSNSKININKNLIKDIFGDLYEKILFLSDTELRALYKEKRILRELHLKWLVKHPIKGAKNIFQGIITKIKLKFLNYPDIILIQSKDIFRIINVLENIKPILKRLFIDIKINKCNCRYIDNIKLFTTWAYPPISEFILNIIVVQNNRKIFLLKENTLLKLNEEVSSDNIINTILNYMEKKYEFKK